MTRFDFIETGMHGEVTVNGTIIDLLKAIPYFMMDYIPTMTVMNSVLLKGAIDAGMSGGVIWDSMTVTPEEYMSIVNIFESEGLKRLDAPDWVTSERDWLIWIYEVDHDVPSKEHKRLHAICEELEKKVEEAHANGRDSECKSLQIAHLEAERKMQEFVDSQFKRPDKSPE